MTSNRKDRRLSAVLMADVADYTHLMATDPEGTVEAWQKAKQDVVVPHIAEYGGRLVKLTGDGFLGEFGSALDAAECAIAIQAKLCGGPLSFRMGISLGDIIDDGEDIHGDGVNIAARLEAIAPLGGVCVSETAKEAIGSSNKFVFEELGPQRLKHVPKLVRAFIVSDSETKPSSEQSGPKLIDQSAVRYVASKDGVGIAYADVGDGYPLVFSGSWMTHLEQDWQNPMARHFLTHLSRDFRVIRYDQRGIGMSDWENVEFSIDRVVDDLECVIDSYDFDRVAILGASQGACIAISYAVRHPERVSHLVLHGGYARGRRRRNDPAAEAQSEALATLIRQGWASTNPAFRQMLTTMYMPDATPEEASWFNNFQRTSSTAENMGKVREMYDEMDISALLDQVRTPTLVIHCSGDTIAPISEGKFISSRIRGTEFVLLESNNHMIMADESDFSVYLSRIRNFLEHSKSV